MSLTNNYIQSFTQIKNEQDFLSRAIEVFLFQYNNVPVYKEWVDLLGVSPTKVNTLDDIPFLPISFFKTHKVLAQGCSENFFFTSSGTTGQQTSKHYVSDIAVYERSFVEGFKYFYDNPENYHILALLPSYLEREHSSLIYMVKKLIEASNSELSGFFLNDYDKLFKIMQEALVKEDKKIILLGVTYALLDFAEQYPHQWKNIIVMETGGMKGKRREMTKEELYKSLKQGFGVDSIASEYGMTELLSQAYAKNGGIYFCPPWMKVLVKDVADPLMPFKNKLSGRIHVIDLMNVYSCSFIATDDLGIVSPDGSFKVLGRTDFSDVRGCNLMLS